MMPAGGRLGGRGMRYIVGMGGGASNAGGAAGAAAGIAARNAGCDAIGIHCSWPATQIWVSAGRLPARIQPAMVASSYGPWTCPCAEMYQVMTGPMLSQRVDLVSLAEEAHPVEREVVLHGVDGVQLAQ